MELLLKREPTRDGTTFGRLFVDGKFEAFTLEDAVREGPKVIHESAVPAGRYRVTITKSARFGRMLPLIENVPGFTGIRIHSGNYADDTSGCILVGQSKRVDSIADSKLALAALQPKIAAAIVCHEPVWITIENAPPRPVQDPINA